MTGSRSATAPATPAAPAPVVVDRTIPNHCGGPRLPHRELFVPPPREIGPVLSAESTLLVSTRSGFGNHCSSVGARGAALFELRGARRSTPRARVLVFVFADATDLHCWKKEQIVDGVYAGTEYEYRWMNAAGGTLLRLRGIYLDRAGPPPMGDLFRFAAATPGGVGRVPGEP